MKNLVLSLVIFFSVSGLYAQKNDSLSTIKINNKVTTVKKTNPKLVNQKLTDLQVTIKKLDATLKEAKALMEKLKDQKDSISELNQDDMLMLQHLMEKKGQLEQMISNVMKAASETQNNIVKNLKAS